MYFCFGAVSYPSGITIRSGAIAGKKYIKFNAQHQIWKVNIMQTKSTTI